MRHNSFARIARIARILGVVALAPVMLLSTGCSMFRPTDQAVVAQAQHVHGELQPAVMKDAQVQAYMDKIGERIVHAAGEYNKDPKKTEDKRNKADNAWLYSGEIRFHLVNSKTLNAFTTGGQHVYIYNELFQQAKSEDELAAVMAHEFAHIYCRHVAKGMTRQTEGAAIGAVGMLAGAAVGKDTGAQVGGGLAGAAAQFLNQGFTRGDEDEADKYGFSFYTRAGWDPNHFADFFKAMIAAGYDKTPGYMSDHPTLASRVQKVNQWVKDLGPNAGRESGPIASASQFRDYQERAATIAKRTPDDSTIQNGQQLAAALPHSCVMPTDPPEAVAARSEIQHRAEQASKKKHSSS
jgi:predicted Zn-dependent protease